jgi:hypothetical protein
MKTKTKMFVRKSWKLFKLFVQIIVWIIYSGIKWIVQAIPKTGYQFSVLVNLVIINYIIWVMVLFPVLKPELVSMLTVKPVIVTKVVTEYVEVEKIVTKAPAMGAEERYYFLLENNKVFRDYVYSINVKRNNPGNLRCADQPNSTCVGGFASFPNIELGFRALVLQCELDQSRNFTLRQFITKFSPHKENDTEHLIRVASEKLNLEEQELINYLDTIRLSQFMTSQEHSIAMVDF